MLHCLVSLFKAIFSELSGFAFLNNVGGIGIEKGLMYTLIKLKLQIKQF